MKMDLSQPTIKVENAKGVSYKGKITKFTLIGNEASINFKTKDDVLIMGIHVPDAVVPEVVDRMLNRRDEDVTITCMRNADEDDTIAMTICDAGEKEMDNTPIYYAVNGILESVTTYGVDSAQEEERALVQIKTWNKDMELWIRESESFTKKDVFHLIREVSFLNKINAELNNPIFIYLFHEEDDTFVLDGISPNGLSSLMYNKECTPFFKRDLDSLHSQFVILPEDKYENNPIIGEIHRISLNYAHDGSFTLTVCDKYDELHTIYMTAVWNPLGKFLFDNLVDMTGKADNEFTFFVKKVPTEEGDRMYLTGLYKE